MTVQIGDEIVITFPDRQPVRRCEVLGRAHGPDGIVYLVQWSDNHHESLLRSGPDMVIEHRHRKAATVKDAPLQHLLEWRPSRGRERRKQSWDELVWDNWDGHLARRVEDIIAGLGLTTAEFSIGGGRTILVPSVVSMGPGPRRELDIEILPGQLPEDFSAHERTFEYHLNMAKVRVIPLGTDRIRLELLPHDDPQPGHPSASR